MFAELGSIFLSLSLCISLLIIGFALSSEHLRMKYIPFLTHLNTAATSSSFICLVSCYVTSDYSVLNVVYNSHKLSPLVYKIAGAWSNHEGSMLLWITVASLISSAFALFHKSNKENSITLVIQTVLLISFVLFTFFTSNPFTRIFPAPTNGLGMTPLLQDIAVTFHPPILYTGYIMLSLPFSITISALLTKNLSSWHKMSRAWSIASWFFLSIGISTGAWWAYRELGWGGFWFWDPVENVSLIPWLILTASIHILSQKSLTKTQLKTAVILNISSFLLVIFGAFIVRSGIITSVHAFAQDSKKGILIFTFMSSLCLFSSVVYFLRKNCLQPDSKRSNILITVNTILLASIGLILLLGTAYPAILETFYKISLSIHPSFYNKLLIPLFLLLAFFCCGIFYKSKSFKFAFLTSLLLTLILYQKINGILSIFGIFISIPVILLTLASFKKSYKTKPGMFFGHLGFGFMILSISLFYGLKQEITQQIKINDSLIIKGHKLKLINILNTKKDNYFAKTAVISLDDKKLLYPEIRFYPIESQQTSEISLHSNIFYDIYTSVNLLPDRKSLLINVQYNAMANFIWLSAFVIVLAGLSLIIRSLKNKIQDIPSNTSHQSSMASR